MSLRSPRTAASPATPSNGRAASPLLKMTLGGVLLALAACRPGGDAEPATSASAPSATDPKPTSEPAKPSDDDRALASTAAPEQADGATKAEPADAPDPVVAEVVPEPDPEPALPEEPYKVLILGDSLAATGFGALLEKKLDEHPHVVCYRKGKSASGLARPDFFDWIGEGKRQIEFRKPDLVVVIMGGNDGQDLTRLRGSKRVPWKDEAWPDAYRERMDTFIGEIAAPDRKLLWLGLPHMGLRSLEKKLVLIRDIQKEAVAALGENGIYLDTVPYTATEDGATLQTATIEGKRKAQTIRAEDRIHFTMAGSQYFADKIYPSVLEALALPDVEDLPTEDDPDDTRADHDTKAAAD